MPSPGFLDSTWRKLFGPSGVMNALDLLRQEEHVTPNPALAAAAARPDTKTYDQERLINVTREHILRERFGNAASTTRLMIITDKPITPPPEWRYIIWETSPLTQPRGGFRNDDAGFLQPATPSPWR